MESKKSKKESNVGSKKKKAKGVSVEGSKKKKAKKGSRHKKEEGAVPEDNDKIDVGMRLLWSEDRVYRTMMSKRWSRGGRRPRRRPR